MDLRYRIESVKKRYSMFPEMAGILNEREGERFSLQHFVVSEKDVMRTSFRRDYDEFIPGEYVRLIDKKVSLFGEVVMSDTPMEKATNLGFYFRANGHVLIGGLGLGMIVLAIQEKPEVQKITVVEKHQEIIDLVADQLPLNAKTEIIHADIFDWKAPKKILYDTIYMDIWNNVTKSDWGEHKSLTMKFARRLNRDNPKSWSGSWRREEFRYGA